MSDEESTDRKGTTPEPELAADGYNAGYADQLFERALRKRGLIPPSLAEWDRAPGPAAAPPAAPPAAREGVPSGADLEAKLRLAAIGGSLVESYRDFGHLGARLDPLGAPPPRHPMLSPEFHGVEPEQMSSIPSSAVHAGRAEGASRTTGSTTTSARS